MSRLKLQLAAILGVWFAGLASPASAGLVGLYQFDNAGNLGLDSSGLGNNLIAFGSGTAYTANGDSGGGVSFTGFGGLTTVSGNVPTGFPLGNSTYTISVDFNTVVAGPLGMIGWGNYGTSYQTNALRLNPAGGVDNYWWGDDLNAGSGLTNGAWQNVTVTYDGTLRSIYINGARIAQDSPGVAAVQNGHFAIGETAYLFGNGYNNTNGEFFVGLLDNVAVYNQSLTASQVSQVVAGNFGLSAVPEPASLTILGMGLIALGWFRRPSRR